MQLYPKWQELGETHQERAYPCDIGGAILHALGMRRAPMLTDKSIKKRHVKRPTRQYASIYVGVTITRNKRYAGQWKTADGRHTQGPYRETPEEAAWDRARALGKHTLEVRK